MARGKRGQVALRRGAAVAVGAGVMVAAACSTPWSSPDAVFPSQLAVMEPVTPPGPAYVVREDDRARASYTLTADGDSRDLGRYTDVTWTLDGRILGSAMLSEPPRMSLIDPQTGGVIAERVAGSIGVTPEAISVLDIDSGTTVTVWSPDLADDYVLEVDESAVETDQTGEYAQFHLHGLPYTLGGVTWVEWSINSEEDDATDHGVLRIEGGKPREVLRNEPVVRLYPSRDGAALLLLMQDNGQDEDCGGCAVEQKVVELDPTSGEIAADYRMPPDYDHSWRVEDMDKVGDVVAVRFRIGSTEEGGTVRRATWTYDGTWTEQAGIHDTRTRWQDGGRLVWRQTEQRIDSGEGARFTLEWHPGDGGPIELFGDDDRCPKRYGFERCPLVEAPGSLLPR